MYRFFVFYSNRSWVDNINLSMHNWILTIPWLAIKIRSLIQFFASITFISAALPTILTRQTHYKPHHCSVQCVKTCALTDRRLLIDDQNWKITIYHIVIFTHYQLGTLLVAGGNEPATISGEWSPARARDCKKHCGLDRQCIILAVDSRLYGIYFYAYFFSPRSDHIKSQRIPWVTHSESTSS